MKIRQISALVAALAMTLTLAAQPAGRKAWNEDWNFTKDGQTRKVDLPHDWGVEQPFLQENPGKPANWPGGDRHPTPKSST